MPDTPLHQQEIRAYVAERSRQRESFVSERDIARRFDLNRSASRKLLLSLEGEGLVESIPQKGYRLIDYSTTSDLTVYRVRCAVESEAARLACGRAVREDILRLMLILEEAQEAALADDHPRFVELDDDFHRALVGASHDNLLIRLFDFIRIPTLRTTPWPEDGMQESHQAHRAIFEAVKARAPEEARAAVEAHLGERSGIVRAITEQGEER